MAKLPRSIKSMRFDGLTTDEHGQPAVRVVVTLRRWWVLWEMVREWWWRR